MVLLRATAAGGRPHAEAVALAEAGKKAAAATVYVTLEPCAHQSDRGPACTDLLLDSKPALPISWAEVQPPEVPTVQVKEVDPEAPGESLAVTVTW